MKITLKEAIESDSQLKNILEVKLPIKIAYKLNKLAKKLQAETAGYNELRVKLVKELGEKTDEKTDIWQVKTENLQEFSDKINELFKTEVEIDFEPLNIEVLGDISIEPKNLPSWLFE